MQEDSLNKLNKMHSTLVYFTILILLCIKTAQCKKVCDLSDDKCTTPQADKEYGLFIYKENLVPAHINDTITKTPDFKFKLFNSLLYNLELCNILLASYNVKDKRFVHILFCPHLYMTTNHTFEGNIGNISITDQAGSFTLSTGKIIFILKATYNLSKNESGYTLMNIENLNIEVTHVEKYKLEETVLIRGDEQKAYEAMVYLNEEGYNITDKLGTQWITDALYEVFSAAKTYLTKVSLEEKFAID